MTKTTPKKKKCKKAIWWSDGPLQIDDKRREVKGKGEWETLEVSLRKLEMPRENFM